MYQGHPDHLLAQKDEFVKLLDKWQSRKSGLYRYDVVIEGDKMYITVIMTKFGKEDKERKEKEAKEKESQNADNP